MSSGLPEGVAGQYREAADYSLVVQADKWVSGPSFVSGKVQWYLQAKIVSVMKQKFGDATHSPFKDGAIVLLVPYCTPGTVAASAGPGQSCAAFTGRKMQIWGLLADMHARKMAKGDLLIQAENLLDIALLP